jgi:hypothetical protein
MATQRDRFSAPPDPAFDDAALDPDDASLPDSGAVVQHPDGYYWLSPDGRQQFGPYDTEEEALAEMNAAGEDDLDAGATPHEALEEAEHELGIADWVDPETGEPGAQAGPHIEDH